MRPTPQNTSSFQRKLESMAPDPTAAAHSAQLVAALQRLISEEGGAIPFYRFMDRVLYAPGLGYYVAGAAKFGTEGDFITAPELSPFFSECIAQQCQEILAHMGGGSIVELGAGTGIMAADLLRTLWAQNALPEQYAILEVSPDLRERQRHTIAARCPKALEKVVWLDRPPNHWRGVLLGNEVLDALPVERFRITAQGPRRLNVARSATGFDWAEGAEDGAVSEKVMSIAEKVGTPFPEDYTSEYVPHLQAWLQSVTEGLHEGVALFIDYGYTRCEYYHPERTMGTLLCHYRHRAHDDPFYLPGLQDITANVDFSAVAEAALAIGLSVAGYTRQNYFLFGCGLMERLSAAVPDEGDPAADVAYLEKAQQVKQLTLPGEMGERFHAIALTRGFEQPLRGFAMRNERYLL